MIAGMAWYGEQVVNRNKPESLYLEQPTESPKAVDFSVDNFNIAFGIQDSNFNEYRDESIY